MGGMMDFVMLGMMVLGGAFLWVNKDNLAGWFQGGNTTDPCLTDFTAPGCGTDPGGSTGSDCGKLCRDKKCTDYKKSCHTGCKYCCDSGTNSPKCSGSPGSQCGDLCSQGGGSCVANWNQCTTNCTKCPTASAFSAIIAAARASASAYTVSCGRYSNPVGVRCSISRTCPNGQKYISPLTLIAGKSASAVVSEMLAAWKKAHPDGCTTGTGCTKTCPPGGYVLNKTACSCNCNPTIKNCTSSSCCIITDGKTKCQASAAGTSQHGSGSGCNTGYYRCRKSDGLCTCCKSATPPTGTCTNVSANCRTCTNGVSCWHNIGCGKYAGKDTSWCINSSNNCNGARSAWLANICPSSGLAQASGLRGRAQGSPGPYGDYKYANTGRVPERVRLAQ